MKFFWFASVMTIGLLLGPTSSSMAQNKARPTTYHFNLIADSRGPVSELADVVSINKSGTVAFAGKKQGVSTFGIYAGNGGSPATIADLGCVEAESCSLVTDINDQGTVLFAKMPAGATRFSLFTGDGGSIRPVSGAENVDPEIRSINNRGAVTFQRLEPDQGVYVSRNGVVIPISAGPVFTSASPAINNRGTVAFINVDLRPAQPAVFSVVTGSGGPLTTVVDTRGIIDGFGAPSISMMDNGSVGFIAVTDTGGVGIFRGDGTALTTIADTRGAFSGLSVPAFNKHGATAFFATVRNAGPGPSGIFTGPDPIADKVIGIGDQLFGSVVTRLVVSRNSLNDHGEIAFFARLADGRDVIVRACPAANSVNDKELRNDGAVLRIPL